ncbi:MAG: hypothetical protein QM766_00885 [Burkholderiaceae bacterium]
MNIESSAPASTPVAKWATRFGVAGLFGGLLMGLGKGGDLAFAVGMALPVGLLAVIGGAVFGLIVKVVNK